MICTLLHLNTFRARVIKISLDREDLWDVLSLFLIHLLVYVGFLCHSYTDLSLFSPLSFDGFCLMPSCLIIY